MATLIASDIASVNSDRTSMPLCRLLWRQNKLLVLQPDASKPHYGLPALAQKDWFRNCLRHSKARAVVIDPALGTEVIYRWAVACAAVQKPIFLRLPTMHTLPHKQRSLTWKFKCVVERLLSLVLLVGLSPLIITFAVLLRLQDGGAAVSHQLCVGQRGRVFAMAQFRRESVKTGQITRLGRFLEVSRLDRLPRLVNVIKGEMTLIGTKPWAIQDVVNIPSKYHPCLKAMPGIVGTRPLGLSINKVDIPRIVQGELSYLKNWSLWRDGQTAAMAVVGFVTGQHSR